MKNEDLLRELEKEFPEHTFTIVPLVNIPEEKEQFGVSIDGLRPRVTFAKMSEVNSEVETSAERLLLQMLLAEVLKMIEFQTQKFEE